MSSPRPPSNPSAQARIEALEARLEHESRERTALVHLVGHELRTPIAIVSGFLKLLAKPEHGPLSDEQTRFVEESLKACRRLDATVEDLLQARGDVEAVFPVVRGPADLHATLGAALAGLSGRFESRGTKVERRFAADGADVAHDPRRIEQVVTNLLGNALRHGRPSGLVHVCTRDVELGGRPGVEVCVEDDGPGIPPADRARLFAPFMRGADAADRGGLGIGLALCRRIVEAHEGVIEIEDSALGGARIVFAWPREAAPAHEESREGRHGRPE